ncbi:MAG: phosphatidylserine decarboxylase [Candidatus Babeliales bacterium]
MNFLANVSRSDIEDTPVKFDLHYQIVLKKNHARSQEGHNASLAQEFQGGSMVLARLCPSDYHRFHFPCDCLPGPTKLINGWLYSVNPLAVKRNIHSLTQNKRTLCELRTPLFGRVLYMEIGATNVGSIQETYTPNQWQTKGAEKGYFEFGGSALILLFAKNTIQFDSDLLAATENKLEIRCLLGQSMGKSSFKA